MNQRTHSTVQEHGAALVTALIFLVVLMVLGTTGVMNNTLQERMAANARNRDLAFQAAEHALDAADTWLMTGNAGGPQTQASLLLILDPDGNGDYTDQVANDGIRPNGESHNNDSGYWQNATWSSDVRSPSTNLSNVQSQPSYVVEMLPGYTDPTPGNACSGGCDYYRVTARGVGGVAEVAVILQTLYQIQ